MATKTANMINVIISPLLTTLDFLPILMITIIMNIRNYSGQIYAEPHKSYENVKHAGASPISEADF
jgi:hypothetical protein